MGQSLLTFVDMDGIPVDMIGYTKLFNSILASTIWREDDKTRLVWITLLAMADKNGIAEGSVPGLADFARVKIEDCEASLAKLMSPDKYSRSQEHDGRRIAEVDGGWQILNHAKYRAKLNADDRREYFRIKKAEERAKPSTIVQHVKDKSTQSTHAEAEADTEAKSDTHTERRGGFSLPFKSELFLESWTSWMKHRSEIKKPVTPTQATKQLKKLEKLGEDRAIAMIEHTISMGWQGLREEDSNNGNFNSQKKPIDFKIAGKVPDDCRRI